jgi:hypothetical protein
MLSSTDFFKIFQPKFSTKNLFRSGSGSLSERFEKSDSDPHKNREDPEHCLKCSDLKSSCCGGKCLNNLLHIMKENLND